MIHGELWMPQTRGILGMSKWENSRPTQDTWEGLCLSAGMQTCLPTEELVKEEVRVSLRMEGTSFWWRCSKLSLYLHHVSIRYNSIHNRIFSGRVWITTSLCFGSRKDLLWVKNVLQVSTNIILISLPFIIWVCSYGVFKSSWIIH